MKGIDTFKVGSLEIKGLTDSSVIWPDPIPRYPGSTPEQWERLELLTPPGDPMIRAGVLHEPITAFYIETAGRRILVDAGAGPYDYYSSTHVPGGRLDRWLSDVGVGPGDIDTVVMTHLHHDHVGWLYFDGAGYFPNARIIAHPADWDYFVLSETAPYFSAPLIAIKDQFDFWTGEKEIAPGITLSEAPGHTPGHAIVTITDGGETFVLSGDLVHTPIELGVEGMITRGDENPEQSRKTRDRLRHELPEGTRLLGAHFPFNRPYRAVSSNGSRQWVPA
jgi:glyoxylase-like metal-dependent hydrolase (beta-lactamase superfamily II)